MSDDIKVKVLKDAVIVAGHPRSGTSLACQLVESAGIEFPSDYEADEYNQGGYYELEMNKKLTKDLIKEAMSVKNTIKLNKIVGRLNNCTSTGGLKILRIPALFFYKHITRNLRCVFIFRNPADVKASQLRRGISSFQPDWFENNNALIAAYENIEDSIIISYESLLAGKKEIKDVFKGIDLDIDFSIIEDSARTQQQSRVVITDEEEKLYRRLKELEEESFSKI